MPLLDTYLPADCNPEDPTTVKGVYLVFMYMKYTIYDIITKTDNKFTKEQVTVLAYNLLCAVKYLHSCNIIHRDLKLENILVSSHLEVQICDFGLARSLEVKPDVKRMKRSLSSACFTRVYRPPEVILGDKEYNEKADLWSLGCLLAVLAQKTSKKACDIEMAF